MNRPPSSRYRLFTLFLLLAVYVLSFGPVHALYANNRVEGPMPSLLVTFYKPVSWLHLNTPLDRPMTAHNDWWQRMLKRS